MKTILKSTCLMLLLLSVLLVQCKKTDTPPRSSAKSLTNPTLDGVVGATVAYDASVMTYTMTVPYGTNVTALKLGFTISTGATVNPVSGSIQNFTNPVTYTVTAEDGSTQTYEVTITSRPNAAVLSLNGLWKYDSDIGGGCHDLVGAIYEIKEGNVTALSFPVNGYGWKAGDNILTNMAQTTLPNNFTANGYSKASGGSIADPNIRVAIVTATGAQSMTVTYTNICNPVQMWVKTK